MAYSKTNWVNENEPAINADNLNKIEAGIEDNSLQLESYGRTINEINNPENWVSVGAEAPTDGRRVWFSKSINLLPNKWLSGSISGTTGEPVSYGSRIYTANMIKVEPNTQYTISNFNTSSYNIINLVDGYTSSGTYIGRIGSVVNGTTITTQSNCEYINVTLNDTGDTLAYSTYQTYLSNGTLKPQLQIGSTLTDYEPYVEQAIKVDETDFMIMPKVLWTGKATSVDIDLTGYSFIEVIFCSNDNFYNSLKVPVSGSTFSRALALCNNYLSDPMSSSGMLYLKYGKATLTQSGITIKSNVEVAISNTAGQIKWSGSGNTLLYITTIIGYK